jgi:Tetratricopeptide repeat
MRHAIGRVCAALLVGLLGALSSPEASASNESAADLVAAGNHSFRQGDPARAIALYRRAQQLGDSSPRLSFNLGVAQYRAGNFRAAIEALRLGTRDTALAPTAWYNLGLAYWASGNLRDAEPCFEWAQRYARDNKLRALATRAAEDMKSGAEPPNISEPNRIFKPSADGAVVFASVSYGHDDNAFRTPGSPYVDLSQTGQPLINPVRQSGSFAAMTLHADSAVRTHHGHIIRGAYDFDGQVYRDVALKAANEHSHRVEVDTEAIFGARSQRRFRTLTYAGQHKEINFDPDTGVERVAASGENLSDRFSYLDVGTRWTFEQALGPFIAGLRVQGELRDYTKLQSISQYDNTLALAGGYLEWPVRRATRLSIAFDRSRRKYSDRIAHSASGAVVAGNPKLQYDYRRLSAGARVGIGKTAFVRLNLERTERRDAFVGYYDYNSIGASLDAIWRVSKRVRFDATVDYYDYKYPNAFAFDVPAGGQRQLKDFEGELAVRVNLWRSLSLWGAVRVRNVSSSDTRADYSRRQVPFGLLWEQRF